MTILRLGLFFSHSGSVFRRLGYLINARACVNDQLIADPGTALTPRAVLGTFALFDSFGHSALGWVSRAYLNVQRFRSDIIRTPRGVVRGNGASASMVSSIFRNDRLRSLALLGSMIRNCRIRDADGHRNRCPCVSYKMEVPSRRNACAYLRSRF